MTTPASSLAVTQQTVEPQSVVLTEHTVQDRVSCRVDIPQSHDEHEVGPVDFERHSTRDVVKERYLTRCEAEEVHQHARY